MLQQSFGELKLLIAIFKMSKNLQDRLRAFAVTLFPFLIGQRSFIGRRVKPTTSESCIKHISQRWRRKARSQARIGKLIVAKFLQDAFLLLPGSKFNLAKLH